MADMGFCFIGGTGRCGTTILRKMLGAHRKVASFPKELRLVADPGGLLDLWDALSYRWDPWRADAAWDAFQDLMSAMRKQTNYPYAGYDITAWTNGEVWHALDHLKSSVEWTVSATKWMAMKDPIRSFSEVPRKEPHDARALVTEFLTTLFLSRNQNATVAVEDTPTNQLAFNRIQDVFGGSAVLVQVNRHPLDVLASFKKAREKGATWPSPDTYMNAVRIRDTLMRWSRTELTAMGVHVIPFELLVGNPGAATEALLQDLGLEWDESMQEPLDPTMAHEGHWRQRLTDSELRKALPLLEPVMEDYGYRA